MPTAKEQLLSMMNPQAARLLDQQMRSQQIAQRSQGAGMLSGLVQAYTGMADAFQGITSGMPMGANEMQALKAQEEQQKLLQEQKQKEQQLVQAMQGAQGPDRVAKLRDAAQRLRATGSFEAIMKAEQIDAQADELAYKLGTLEVSRQKSIGNAKGYQSFEGEHFRDEDGNIYATVTSVNKDTNEVTTKYTPLTGGPEYDGKKKLVPVQKTGGGVGLTAMEYSDLVAVREGKVETQKQFSRMKADSAASYRENQSRVRDLERAVQLVKEEMAKGNLQGGISANVANAIYKLTGTMPKNLAELNNIFGESTYSRLKPLFGGVISEGERQSVEDLYFSISKSGKVNLALLERFLGKAKGALVNHNILLSSNNMEEYTQRLIDGGLVGEEQASGNKETSTGKPRKIWDPKTNGWIIR